MTVLNAIFKMQSLFQIASPWKIITTKGCFLLVHVHQKSYAKYLYAGQSFISIGEMYIYRNKIAFFIQEGYSSPQF